MKNIPDLILDYNFEHCIYTHTHVQAVAIIVKILIKLAIRMGFKKTIRLPASL